MFLDEVHDLKDRFPSRLQIVHVLSREASDVELLSGRLDGERLSRDRGRAGARRGRRGRGSSAGRSRCSSTCAPPLAALGVPAARVHSELFHADPVPRAPVASLAGGADGAARVTIRLDGRSSDARPAPRRRTRPRGRAPGPLRPALRLQGRRLRHLPRAAGRGHRRHGRQLRARARRDRARLRAHLPVAPDLRGGRARLRRLDVCCSRRSCSAAAQRRYARHGASRPDASRQVEVHRSMPPCSRCRSGAMVDHLRALATHVVQAIL